jgi:hypothetical protein
MQYTDALVNLARKKLLKKRFNSVLVTGRGTYRFTYQELAQIYRSVVDEFGDKFDFLAVVNAGTRVTHSSRFYTGFFNDADGIGLPRFDYRDLLGSESIQGLVTYPIPDLFPGGTALSHEIGHRWAVFLPTPFGSPIGAHWPLGKAGACGIMGVNGFGGKGVRFPYIIKKKDNRYELTLDCSCSPKKFKPIELYVMGLWGKTRANRKFFNFDDQTQQASGLGCGESVEWHGPVTRFNAATLAREVGERIPDTSESQKEFRVAAVLISEELLSKDVMAQYSDLLKADAKLFRRATRRAGRLLVSLRD